MERNSSFRIVKNFRLSTAQAPAWLRSENMGNQHSYLQCNLISTNLVCLNVYCLPSRFRWKRCCDIAAIMAITINEDKNSKRIIIIAEWNARRENYLRDHKKNILSLMYTELNYTSTIVHVRKYLNFSKTIESLISRVRNLNPSTTGSLITILTSFWGHFSQQLKFYRGRNLQRNS